MKTYYLQYYKYGEINPVCTGEQEKLQEWANKLNQIDKYRNWTVEEIEDFNEEYLQHLFDTCPQTDEDELKDSLALQPTYGDSGDYYEQGSQSHPIDEFTGELVDFQEKHDREEAKAFNDSLSECPYCKKRRFDGIYCFNCKMTVD